MRGFSFFFFLVIWLFDVGVEFFCGVDWIRFLFGGVVSVVFCFTFATS